MELNQIQVNCTDLTREQINEMASRVPVWQHNCTLAISQELCYFSKFKSDNEWYIRSFDATKTTITYNEFLKLTN